MLRKRKRPVVHLDKSKAMVPNKRNVLYRRFHLFSVIYSCHKWNRQIAKKFVVTDSFFAFNYFYYDRQILRIGGRSAILELMCHPGHKAYQTETEDLMRDTSWLDKKSYNLISYREL